MIIYQLHEYSGEYEDYFDRIIGSYLRKERAEEEKAAAEKQEELNKEHANQCANCPYVDNWDRTDYDMLVDEMKKHCDRGDIQFVDNGEPICKNYHVYWDINSFEIQEVEVEE